MEIKKTTKYTITFWVEAFWNEEGGMGHNHFGNKLDRIEDAIHNLELAKERNPDNSWIITCYVETVNQ